MSANKRIARVASAGRRPMSIIASVVMVALLANDLTETAAAQSTPETGAIVMRSVPAVTGCSTSSDSISPLSLGTAVDLALCNNEQIRAAYAVIREQAAALGEAKSAYLPNVNLTVSGLDEGSSYSGADTPPTSKAGNTVYADVEWLLFDFGGRSAARRAAEATLKAAVASKDALIQKTLDFVVQTYFDAVNAAETVKEEGTDELVARATWLSAQRRQAAGEGALGDTLQAETALARASLERNRALGTYQKEASELNYVLGLAADTAFALPDQLGDVPGTNEQALGYWLADAEKNHPAIVAARATLDAARSEVNVARSSGRPTVDLSVNYYGNGFPNEGLSSTNLRETTVGISVTVPIFDGFSSHYKVEAAKATVDERTAELSDTEQATLSAVVAAYGDAESASNNLNSSLELIRAAQAGFATAQRRYNAGVGGIVELLSAQSALADADEQRLQCLAEWNEARFRLMVSAGRFDRSLLPH